MRILALTNLYPNPFQPHRAPFNREQVRRLAARHPLAVIAPILWTDELSARRRGGARLPEGRRIVHDGVEVDHPRYLYPPKILRDWYGPCFRWSIRATFERAVAEFRPDLVYATWAYPDGWAAVELARRTRLPVVVKVHGSDILTLNRYPRRRRHSIEALRDADAIVAVSRDLADRVARLGADPGRVRVVYNGVDAARFRPGPRSEARARLGLEGDGPLVLAVGNLVRVKGLDVLIEACAAMARAGLRFTCILLGEGSERARLEALIGRLGLRGRVRLVGPRPHDELPDWYRASDVVALPSRSEGVPNVILEAAACGVPFVASRVGGVPEVAGLGDGRLVPPGDPGPLAEALSSRLTGSPAIATRPTRVRSHEDAVDELDELFEQALGAAVGRGRGSHQGSRAPGPCLTPASRH